jgi:hypothetical protein
MQHPICCTQLPKTNFSHIKDWIALNEFTYTEEANGHFYDTVRSIFNATVQKKKNFHLYKNYPRWFSKETISILKIK